MLLWYRRSCFGGRSLVARLLDALFWSFLCFAALYLLIDKRPVATALAIPGGIACLTLLLWQRERKFSRYMAECRKRELTRLATERLVLADRTELEGRLMAVAGEDARLLTKLSLVEADDILPYIVRSQHENRRLKLYCSAKIDKSAEELAERIGGVELYGIEELIKLLKPERIEPREVDERLRQAYVRAQRSRRDLVPLPLGGTALYRYLILGVLLLALSFVAPRPLYFRLLSTLSFLAFTVLRIRNR